MSARRKNWTTTDLRASIRKWKKTLEPNKDKKIKSPVPTLENFYVNCVSRNTVKQWKNANPKLHAIFEEEVREFVRDRMTQILLSGSNNTTTGVIFYLKSAFKKEFNDQPLQETETITINLNTTNTGKNTIKKNINKPVLKKETIIGD